jgi:hypothetical protein
MRQLRPARKKYLLTAAFITALHFSSAQMPASSAQMPARRHARDARLNH